MRLVISLLLGVVVGIAAAGAVLYYNPLTDGRGSALDASTILHYEFPSESILAITHGEILDIPKEPPAIDALWEAAIRKAGLSLLVLKDQRGLPAAIASRISKLSPQTNLLSSGLLVADQWLITMPGQGSYVIASESNVWPLLKDTLINVDLLKRAWDGPTRYYPTTGPDNIGTASVLGVTGEFRNTLGSATDSFQLDDYRGDLEFAGTVSGELALQLRSSE